MVSRQSRRSQSPAIICLVKLIPSLLIKNEGTHPTWSKFKDAILAKFDKAEVREELLREKLEQVRYQGPAKISEFCADLG
jgi:hypothetical protein